MGDAISLTFEDWKAGNWPPSVLHIDHPFEQYLRDIDDQYRLFALSDVEYQKIAQVRNAIFEKQVALFLKGQTDYFEERFSNSLEKNSLANLELQKVNQKLTDEDYSGGYVFPNPNGGILLVFDLGGILRKEGEPPNPFAHWYTELIVQGRDARPYIEPKHENDNMLPMPVAIHVLYRYKKFLEARLAAMNTEPKRRVGRQPRPPRTFQSLFKGMAEMERLLAAAKSAGIIAKDGEGYAWVYEGALSHCICALWFAAVDAGLTKEKIKNNEATTKAIQQFFRMESLSKDTIDNGNPHNEEFKKIKAAIEKNLKKQ